MRQLGVAVLASGMALGAAQAEAATFTGLGALAFPPFSEAFALSGDGDVAVGTTFSPSGFEAFSWEGGVMTGLGDLAGGVFSSFSAGVDADGSVVVGTGSSASGTEAFRWEASVMTGLGCQPRRLAARGRSCHHRSRP